MPVPDTKHPAAPRSTWIHDAIFRAQTQKLLSKLLEPSGAGGPVAVSILFRDAPFHIQGYAFDGVLTEVPGGFRRAPAAPGATGTGPAWDDLLAELDRDGPLVCAIGDGIAKIRERGLELREGQAYLTPVSLSILNVEARRLTKNRARSTAHHAIHFVQRPASPEQKHHLQQVSGALQAYLDFLSDPAAANRTTASAIRKRIPNPPKVAVPTREELDEFLQLLK